MKPPATGVSPRRWQRSPQSPRRRRWVGVLVVAVAAGTTAIYYQSFFAPRERARTPSPELAALLAADAPFQQVFWLASPHQNLGALDERVGDLERYLAELSRLTGIARPRLPAFGPFSLPPARELALAWNGAGEGFLGVARIEPAIGWAARLAGFLAGNPWLAGGKVDAGGRSYEVRWQGPLWIVASGLPARLAPPTPALPSAVGEGTVAAARQPQAIAQLLLRGEVGPLPAGHYVLARGSDGLELRSGVLPEGAQPASEWSFPGVALWMSSTERGPVGGPGLLLLWEAAEGAIPRVAVLQRGGGRNYRLPGESILQLLGAGEPAYRLGWSVRGTQKSARREALLLVPWFERHLPRPRARQTWLGRAGRLMPAASARTLDLVVRNLRRLPLVPPAEVERIAGMARLLAPFSGCAAIAFEVWHEPQGVRVRLCSRAPGPEAEVEAGLAGEPEPMSSLEDGEIDEGAPIR